MRFIVAALLAFTSAAHAQELTGTLRKIHEQRSIALGVRDSAVPFSYLDGNQKPVGFAIDICLRVVEAIKAELKLPELAVVLTPVTSSTRIPSRSCRWPSAECACWR